MVTLVPATTDFTPRATPVLAPTSELPAPRLDRVLASPPPPPPVALMVRESAVEEIVTLVPATIDFTPRATPTFVPTRELPEPWLDRVFTSPLPPAAALMVISVAVSLMVTLVPARTDLTPRAVPVLAPTRVVAVPSEDRVLASPDAAALMVNSSAVPEMVMLVPAFRDFTPRAEPVFAPTRELAVPRLDRVLVSPGAGTLAAIVISSRVEEILILLPAFKDLNGRFTPDLLAAIPSPVPMLDVVLASPEPVAALITTSSPDRETVTLVPALMARTPRALPVLAATSEVPVPALDRVFTSPVLVSVELIVTSSPLVVMDTFEPAFRDLTPSATPVLAPTNEVPVPRLASVFTSPDAPPAAIMVSSVAVSVIVMLVPAFRDLTPKAEPTLAPTREKPVPSLVRVFDSPAAPPAALIVMSSVPSTIEMLEPALMDFTRS